MILEKLYSHNCNHRNPLILALNSSNIDEIECSSNYLRIKNEINHFGELRLCQLPFFDENRKAQAQNIRKKELNQIPYKSPIRYMSHREKSEYFHLSTVILEAMTECNKNDNYLGITSGNMMDILDSVAQKKEKL